MRLHQAAQSGHDEYAVLLGFFDGGVGEVLEERRRGLVVSSVFSASCRMSCVLVKPAAIQPPQKNWFNTKRALSYTLEPVENTYFTRFLNLDAGEARLYRRFHGQHQRNGPAMRTTVVTMEGSCFTVEIRNHAKAHFSFLEFQPCLGVLMAEWFAGAIMNEGVPFELRDLRNPKRETLLPGRPWPHLPAVLRRAA